MEVTMSFLLIFVIIVTDFIIFGDAAKILVFGISNSRSHMMSNGRIADTLALAGHNVTFLSFEHTIATKDFPTTKHAKIVTIGRIPKERLEASQKGNAEWMKSIYEPTGIFYSYFSMDAFSESLIGTFDLAFTEDQETIEKLKSENFDAIVYESLFPHGSAFGHLLGINVHFMVHSATIFEFTARLFGIPTPTGWVPSVGSLSVSDRMTFWERAQNWLENELVNLSGLKHCERVNSLYRKHFGSDFPKVQDLIKEKTPIMFVSVNEFIEFPRPILHNVVYIGGLGMKASRNESLTEPFLSQMNKGKKGVVFFSLGSNVDSIYLPTSVKTNLLDAFADFKDYHFIVKLEKGDEFGINYAKTKSNIFVTHWAPQNLLLKHPNLKLFMTHGGYNSLLEVAHSGKPILLMPMMYDQTRNAQTVQRNGWGRVLNKMELLKGKEKLVGLLEQMLNNDIYLKNAQRTKHLLETKPFSANELFIKYIQFVMDNNGELPELRAAGAEMSFITQFNIDIYFLVISLGIILLSILLYSFYYVAKLFRKLFACKNIEKKKRN